MRVCACCTDVVISVMVSARLLQLLLCCAASSLINVFYTDPLHADTVLGVIWSLSCALRHRPMAKTEGGAG